MLLGKFKWFDYRLNPVFLVSFNVLTHIGTLWYSKRAILLHSCFVTYTLVSIIIDVKDVFKRLRIPMVQYRNAIMIFSLFHLVNPLLMTVRVEMNKYFVYAHLCACFILHIVHMHYITIVFRLMNYKDRKHWILLFIANALEMCTNVCLICEYYDTYVYTAIITECVCPYVLMYVRKKSRRSVERFTRLNSHSPNINIQRINHNVIRRVNVCTTPSILST